MSNLYLRAGSCYITARTAQATKSGPVCVRGLPLVWTVDLLYLSRAKQSKPTHPHPISQYVCLFIQNIHVSLYYVCVCVYACLQMSLVSIRVSVCVSEFVWMNQMNSGSESLDYLPHPSRNAQLCFSPCHSILENIYVAPWKW